MLMPVLQSPALGRGRRRKEAGPPWQLRPEPQVPAMAHGETRAVQTTSEHVFWKTIYKAAGILALQNFRVGKAWGARPGL